jgi:hypothetical protein
MQLPEAMLSESLDEIIRRTQLRLDQEHIHVSELTEGGAQHASAKATSPMECTLYTS